MPNQATIQTRMDYLTIKSIILHLGSNLKKRLSLYEFHKKKANFPILMKNFSTKNSGWKRLKDGV